MRKRILVVFVLILLTLICLNLASAATYYVNNKNSKCSDSYTITQAKNISTPWCDLQIGLNKISSGDTLYLLAGEYNGQFILQNKDFTSNVSIRAYPGNVVNITNYNKAGYASGSNSLWTNIGGGIWKTKLSSSEIPHPQVYYKDGTKFFTWAIRSNFMNSKYAENTWYDSSTKELYLKFSDTSKNPNKIVLYLSNYMHSLTVSKNSMTSKSFINIRDLNFKYSSYGLLIDDQSNVLVGDCSFDGAYFSVAVSNHDIAGRTNIFIINNKFNGRANPSWYEEDMKNEGTEETSAIYVMNHKGKVMISDNEFTYLHGGILLATNEPDECDNSEIYNNVFRFGRGSQIEIENYCSNTKYHHNKIFDNGFAGVSFAPADASAGRCEFYNNIIVAEGKQHDSMSVSYDNYAIKAQSINGNNVKNWYMHHNTFYGYGRALNTIEKASSGISEGAWFDTTWKDNIFYAETEYVLLRTGLSEDGVFFDYNLYYLKVGGWKLFQRWNTNEERGYLTLADAKASSDWNGNWDLHSVEADPLFTDIGNNDLTPKPGSPACTMSSTGSYVGALPCAGGSNPVCGDKICNGKENCSTCSGDCGVCPVAPVCGDKVCNGKENCSICSGDCGVCPAPSTKITACTLSDKSWNEDSLLLGAYDLNACFKDPLGTKLGFGVSGKSSINVSINKGIVDLSAPINWNGAERVYFYAYSGNRSTSSNRVTLTVLPVPDCGDGVCEAGELCDVCSSDCGVCPSSSGGGGGGGGSITPTFNWVCGEWSECLNSEQVQLCDDPERGSQKTNTRTCEQAPVVVETPPAVEQPAAASPGDGSNDVLAGALPSEKKIGSNVVETGSGFDESAADDEANMIKEPSNQMTGLVAENTGAKPEYKFIAGLLIVMIVGSLVFVGLKSKQEAIESRPTKRDYIRELNDYVVQSARSGFSEEHVRTALAEVGWSKDVIETIMAHHETIFTPKTQDSVAG